MARLLTVLVLLSASPALAAGPEACDPREDATVCELKVERNNALDELAITAGKLRIVSEREAAEVKWWAEYAEGVNLQSQWWRQYSEGVNAKAQYHH